MYLIQSFLEVYKQQLNEEGNSEMTFHNFSKLPFFFLIYLKNISNKLDLSKRSSFNLDFFIARY